ncbi:Protein tilB [Cichlidogyrus casuarinus]|uniref:Protein tilB n=1 Tax=Cichlidogyrus casuarinus TaxID=1844966 RepID=A0ABD2PWL0_9PLAT
MNCLFINKILNGKLKKLEYLNLALNNIERIENLEGCESLNKLDLTVNFVGELTSITNLTASIFLRELFLTGNPCTQFDGYRKYVIASLPQLTSLDGQEIEKKEIIEALQEYEIISKKIEEQERDYAERRREERLENLKRMHAREDKIKQSGEKITDEIDKEFWQEVVPFSPESRVESHNMIQRKKHQTDKPKEAPQPRPLFAPDGRPYNINEPKINFTFEDSIDESLGCVKVLKLNVFRHLDTSLIDCDIHPNYVRVTIKGKLLQLNLEDEISPDNSFAQRSRTTGEMILKLKKIKQDKLNMPIVEREIRKTDNKPTKTTRFLEFEEQISLSEKLKLSPEKYKHEQALISTKSRKNDKNFVDDPEVPPLA